MVGVDLAPRLRQLLVELGDADLGLVVLLAQRRQLLSLRLDLCRQLRGLGLIAGERVGRRRARHRKDHSGDQGDGGTAEQHDTQGTNRPPPKSRRRGGPEASHNGSYV